MTTENEKNTTAENEQRPNVIWDGSQMKTTYVNATNVVAGKEEVMMLLGINKNWHAEQSKVTVELQQRVVMNPYTAKRLAAMLYATVQAYENKYGKIEIEEKN
ncbi:MAG: DUF3467 domain-containing protein [Fibrobacter sp.]|nr:DUF3467 domain-containing protein [Fibrobacter sp.]